MWFVRRCSFLPFRPLRAVAAVAAAVLAAGPAAGCADRGADRSDGRITVWSLENLPPRMEAARRIADDFEEDSGVEVELVGVAEAQLPQMVMSAAAAGRLPDVIGAVPLAQVWQMHGNGLLDTRTAGGIVEELGPETFDRNALALASDGPVRLAVPSDAWLQVLAYRKDLFRRAGLPAPTTYDALLTAARTLDRGRTEGIAAATDPGDVFTQQSFEDLALANGCRLVDDRGAVALDSGPCRTAFGLYGELTAEHGPPGTQTVDTTRATYFSGRSAMLLWSSMVLDELAGLRADALPACPQCTGDPGFLARNTGIVTALRGPDGRAPAQYGEVTSWAVTRTAETSAARDFVRHMTGPGYEAWFGTAAEGKIPVRSGTRDDPDRYTRAWRSAPIGTDARRPFDEVYPDALLDELLAGVGAMRRWGIAEGQGALVGATMGELPVPRAIGAVADGRITAAQAAREAAEEVEALRTSLE